MDSALKTLVRLLAHSRLSTARRIVAHGRELAWDLGLQPNPVGADNHKTGVPGTYRPVGRSCPPCPLERVCYARYGPAGWHQDRSTAELAASLSAAAIAMVAAAKTVTLARLHVSGDFYRDGHLDEAYLAGLEMLAREVRARLFTDGPVAWTYTHAPPEIFEARRLTLEQAGVVVLYSGQSGSGGALVHPHRKLEELAAKYPTVRFRACPAQIHGATCRECRLCWRSRELGLCIVFDPHGPGAEHYVEAHHGR